MTERKKSTATAKGQCAGAEVCPLSRVPVGSTVCIKALVASPEVRERLIALGITEEQELKLLSRESTKANFVCKVCDTTLDLNAELAEVIMVENLAFSEASESGKKPLHNAVRIVLLAAAAIVIGVLVWQGVTAKGSPDPTNPHSSPAAATLDIGVLVFREGLETILVLAAILASMTGARAAQRKPIVAGASMAFVGTIITWFAVVGIMSNLQQNVSALNLQAATGLLAVIVLLVVMNWFFHKIYWGGWIAMHNRNKKKLLNSASVAEISTRRLTLGLALLGFASIYREGFEVVLFLQTYYLQMGGKIVLVGALLGLFFTGIVAVLTFVAHRRLPYRKMLVLTGFLLGIVLLVMVGEQAQEMQLAGWIRTTSIPWLENKIPDWAGLWFSVFPTVQTLAAQGLALVVVVGSYFLARYHSSRQQEETPLTQV